MTKLGIWIGGRIKTQLPKEGRHGVVGRLPSLVASEGRIGFQFKRIVVAHPVSRSIGGSDAAVAVLRTPYARTRHESVKLDRVAPATTRQQRRRRWQFPTYDREQGLDLRYLRRTHWKGELFLVFDHWSSDFSCHWSGSGHDLFVLSMQFPCNTKID